MNMKIVTLISFVLLGVVSSLPQTDIVVESSNSFTGRLLRQSCCLDLQNRCAEACIGQKCSIKCGGKCGPSNTKCGPYTCGTVTKQCSTSASAPAPETAESAAIAIPVPLCTCPAVFLPVCGADGQTYGNPCEAECEGVEVLSIGGCSSLPACSCFQIHDPVCGEDGQTYSNTCEAGCANVEVASEGECEDGPDVAVFCPAVFKPVCGLDGVTYSNECKAKVAKVPVAYFGACGSGNEIPCGGGLVSVNGRCSPPLPSCICAALYDPVCGVDGHTYSSSCQAACANVPLASKGECTDGPNLPVFCPAVFKPVCGVDGVTYSNECQAKVAEVLVSHSGACSIGNEIPCGGGLVSANGRCSPPIPSCICTAVYDPVCGVDGQTYSSSCQAVCEFVKVAYSGECN